MQTTHSLTYCPLYNVASTIILDTSSRTITHASNSLIELLDNQDPTGTRWPSKEDQQLCFTTLIPLTNSNGRQRQKRLLTCEHINNDDTTTILCADIKALEQVYSNNNNNNNNNNRFFSTMMMGSTFDTKVMMPTMILRMNPYGVIQSVFSTTTYNNNNSNIMIGQPLMRFIHNDDIPILCNKLRQVTRYQQNMDEDDDDDDEDEDDDTEFTSISFDIRCDLTSLFNNNNKYATKSILEKDTTFPITDGDDDDDDDDDEDEDEDEDDNDDDDDNVDHDILYHFTTVVTSTQDIVCVMRPFSHGSTMDFSNSTSRFSRPCTDSSLQSSNATSLMTSFYQLSQLLTSSSYKLKHILQRLQHALWDATEQGLMLLAHYVAMIMVLALQYYQLARHPSFWLETSELALRCLVAETKSRSELHPVLSWLPSRRFFGLALDHGSEWLISSLSSSSLSL